MDSGPSTPDHPFRLIRGGLDDSAPSPQMERWLADQEARRNRPDLRRAPLTTPATLRIRATINDSAPEIWRTLEVRSHLTLADLHAVLQIAFDWQDYHLYRFSLGGGPFDIASQLFLSEPDLAEGEDHGLPLRDVRIDETLQQPGDVLEYLYDYGDNWDLTLELLQVLPVPDGAPPAIVIDGERAAPPEDCGGLRDARSLSEVLDDPAAFDPAPLNTALSFSAPVDGSRLPEPLARLLLPVVRVPEANTLARGVMALPAQEPRPSDDELTTAFHAVQWFLDRADDGGIPLTKAGYLKPDDTFAASEVVPNMAGWIGRNNRESQSFPLLEFRQSLLEVGLLRKYKGHLLLTKAGAAARRSPEALWEHLAASLTRARGQFEAIASPLMAATAAVSGRFDPPAVAAVLTAHGWRSGDSGGVHPYAADAVPAVVLLENLRPLDIGEARNIGRRPEELTPVAAALAREAIRRLN